MNKNELFLAIAVVIAMATPCFFFFAICVHSVILSLVSFYRTWHFCRYLECFHAKASLWRYIALVAVWSPLLPTVQNGIDVWRKLKFIKKYFRFQLQKFVQRGTCLRRKNFSIQPINLLYRRDTSFSRAPSQASRLSLEGTSWIE